MLDLLQAPAVILGIVGALFVSGYSLKSRRFGFILWILGNAFWVSWGLLTQNPYVVIMFGFYWLTACLGFSNTQRRTTP